MAGMREAPRPAGDSIGFRSGPRRLALPILPLVLLIILCDVGAAPACPVEGFPDWLDAIAKGRYQEAHKKVWRWRRGEGCDCEKEGVACMELTLPDGETLRLAPSRLSRVVDAVIAWENAARKACEPLSGADGIGRYAKEACLSRHAEKMTGLDDDLARRLLGGTMAESAKRIAAAPKEETGDGVGRVSSPRKIFVTQRDRERAENLARDICRMRGYRREVQERLETLKRHSSKMRQNKAEMLRREQNLLRRTDEALDRALKEFRRLIQRDFSVRKDCRPRE